MNKRVSSKIFQISLLVSIAALSTLFSESSDERASSLLTPKKIWSVSEESPISSTEETRFLYSLDSSTPADLKSRQTDFLKKQAAKPLFFDFEKTDSADISTARQGTSKTFTQEEKEKPLINLKNTSSSEEQAPQSRSLGKNRVSVPAFTSLQAPEKEPLENNEQLSFQKTPFIPTSAEGLFGPLEENGENYEEEIASAPTEPKSPLAQTSVNTAPLPSETGQLKTPPKTILINFNNVSIIEYIKFISRITNKNFIFDEANLQFNVTIISEEPTTLENVLTALVQELRIHGLSLIEEGNSFIIHKNDAVKGLPPINVGGVISESTKETELITQVFRLNTLDPAQARNILRPMLSKEALIETAASTRNIIITDLVSVIEKVEQLLKSIDAPNSGMVIGQYVVRNAFMDNLIELAKQIMAPIAQDQKVIFVPHPSAKSIFIVSSPFIVERTISVLQHLDNFHGTTKIYNLEDLKFVPPLPGTTSTPSISPEAAHPETPPPQSETAPILPMVGPKAGQTPSGKWEATPHGNWIFRPALPEENGQNGNQLPQGKWMLDDHNRWFFVPEGNTSLEKTGHPVPPGEGPKGEWTLSPQGQWVFQLHPEEQIQPSVFSRPQRVEDELPVGHIERTKFYIFKLQFKKGKDIVAALQNIAESLQMQGSTNMDLIGTILSAQWLETSNAIIITGTESSIDKVKELIEEIDVPQRQVLIEMLIIETTIDDSLTYGVSWGTKSGGGNTATAQAFVGGGDAIVSSLATSGISNGRTLIPDSSSIATAIGYHMGVIGQRLTHGGTQFASLGALVSAVHTQSGTNVVINPKIITEDNKPAEIFVGVNSPYLSNSIANDQGSVITTNVEFRDTGTTLKITPLIGNGDLITMEIEEEVSRNSSAIASAGSSTSNSNLTPTTSIERTETTIHVPNKHFVVMSGMLQDENDTNLNQFPCLGGIPILGAGFKNNNKVLIKRNLMIFLRPEIIDTAVDFTKVTRREQQIFKQKSRIKKSWKYEVDEALDFMNIKPECGNECSVD